ncbi:MAG TPA: response regulator transcription factor [Verrucomicrobiae bacterium]|jgi:DNA-binding NarL/FixJ family response regulator
MNNIAIVANDHQSRESLVRLIDGALDRLYIYSSSAAEDLQETVRVKGVSRLKEESPAIALLMLADNADFERILEVLRAGASGSLLKRGVVEGIVEALSGLKAQGRPMKSFAAHKGIKTFRLSTPAEPGAPILSGREQEILAHLSKGYANKEIAWQMHISMSTVRTHLRNIYKKLHVRCRTEAVVRFGHQSPAPAFTFS